MKRQRESLFLSICLSFAAALLVLSLLGSIRLTALNDRAAALERELESARTENAVLRASYETSVSLPELERRAQELGMQRRTAAQTVWLPWPEA